MHHFWNAVSTPWALNGERWPSRLVATAEEDRLSFRRRQQRPIRKKPRQRGRGLGWDMCVTEGHTVTIRTVMDTHFLYNSAISEIRLV